LAALALLAIALPAKAADRETVQSLYQRCDHKDDQFDMAFCLGFVSGAAGVMFWNGRQGKEDINTRSAVGVACNSDAKITQA